MGSKMEVEDSSNQPLPPLNKSASRTSMDDGVSWFHGKITRNAAERLLEINGGEEGLFLVRESISSPGDYVLSLIHNKVPIHYQIRQHGDDAFFSIDDGPVVHGLEMLISYYQEDAQGLSTKLCEMCKAHPPPPDTRRHGRTNLLHRATKEGEITVVRELLKSGYHNLDAKNQEGQTAIHLASICGFDDILDLLLEVGANPNIRDGNGLTPLHYACQNNKPSTAKVLLDHGANTQVRASDSGWVPLHFAANSGFTETSKVLLEANAPLHPRSNYYETPLDLAKKNNHVECVSLLESFVPPQPTSSRSDWFHENLDREGTFHLLQSSGLKDGMFLVRRSTRKKETYVLCMVHNGHAFNYEIQRKDNFYYIDDGPYLQSLDLMIDHYRRMADGLPTNLSEPLPPRSGRDCEHQSKPVKDFVEDVDYCYSETHIVNGKATPLSKSKKCKEEDFFRPNLIKRDSLEIGLPVGEGEFGSVLRGKWIKDDHVEIDVAIKTMREDQMQSKELFVREVEVMVGLDHKCVVKLLGVCLGPPLMMVQELVPMGSMLDYILDYPDEISVKDLLLWSAEIACGMTYLENKRFVHRDLAARNILLASRTEAKLSDFGLSRALRNDSEYYRASSGGRWPVKWYAPESINFATFSHSSDMWSYGITLWEMFTYGDPPYGNMTGDKVIQFIESNRRLDIPQDCPEKIRQIINQCWLYRPEERPTFKQVYDLFCTDPDFKDLWAHIKDQ